MNHDEKSVKVSDAVRLSIEKDSIKIYFGKRIDENNVEVVQIVSVSPETALQLTGKLFLACAEYQKKNRDLGIRLDDNGD